MSTHYIPGPSGWTSQSGNGKLRLELSRSYDRSTNKSTLTFRLYVSSTSAEGNFQVTRGGTLKVNGSTLVSFPQNILYTVPVFRDGNWRQVTSAASTPGPSEWTVELSHDAAGKLTVSAEVDLSLWYQPGGTLYTMRFDSSAAITVQEPRGSAIESVTSPVNTGDTMTLSVSRASSAFCHKATLKCGSTVLYTSGAFATSIGIPAPRSWFQNYPNNASLACTVSVQTYTDQSCSTAIGDPATASVTLKADSGMRPVLQAGYAAAAPDNTGTAAAGITGYVSGVSRARVTLDPTKLDMSAAVGASVASIAVTGGGVEDTASPYITGVLTGTATITVTVTDSRGRSAVQTLTVGCMPYAPPTVSQARAARSDSAGEESEDGNYARVFAAAGCSSLEGQNSVTLSVSFAHGGGSFGPEQTVPSAQWTCLGGDHNPDLPTRVRFRAADALGNSAETVALIPPRVWAMKFRESGLGVGFGMKPDEDRVLQLPAGWKIKIGNTIVAQG